MWNIKRVLLIFFIIILLLVVVWRAIPFLSQPLFFSFLNRGNTRDIFGGDTPNQLLDLFVKAIEENNPELAAKYFFVNNEKELAEWQQVMVNTFQAGNFPEILRNLKKAQPEPNGIIGDKFYQFLTKNEQGEIILYIDLIFDGQLWKIDSI